MVVRRRPKLRAVASLLCGMSLPQELLSRLWILQAHHDSLNLRLWPRSSQAPLERNWGLNQEISCSASMESVPEISLITAISLLRRS